MRVGDAEREAAAAEVREHFASGRLTQDELNQRLDQTFAAKTRGDLNAVFTDLPHATWRDATAGGARDTAGDPYGGRTPLGRPGQRWADWGTGEDGRTDDGANGPFGGGPADPHGAGRPARKHGAAALTADRRPGPSGAEGMHGCGRPGPQLGWL